MVAEPRQRPLHRCSVEGLAPGLGRPPVCVGLRVVDLHSTDLEPERLRRGLPVLHNSPADVFLRLPRAPGLVANLDVDQARPVVPLAHVLELHIRDSPHLEHAIKGWDET